MSRSRTRKISERRLKPREQQFLGRINCALMGVTQFVVLCPIAMLLYPDPFSLADSYFSELGCLVSAPHGTYWRHALLFNGSLAALGVSLFLLFLSLVRVAEKNGPGELLVCGGSGMAASAALVLVAMLSWNRFPFLHTMAMLSWLFFMLPMLSGWIDWSARGRWALLSLIGRFAILAVCLYPIAVVVSWGALLQKLIVFLALLWLGVFVVQLRAAVRQGAIRRWIKSSRSGKHAARWERPVRVRYIGDAGDNGN